jgi:murein DD-endopeptidase MepM/ murein hydrolase activator NlpD
MKIILKILKKWLIEGKWLSQPRLMWIFALTVILTAAVASIAVIGKEDPESALEKNEPAENVSEIQGPPIRQEWRINKQESLIPRGSTLQDVLFQFDFNSQDIHKLVTETRDVYNLNRVASGNRLIVERYQDGLFRKLEYQVDDEKILTVFLRDGAYKAELKTREFNVAISRLYGQISDSLWNSLISQGEDPRLIMAIHEVMQWDIDFTTIQPNDSFKIIVEKKYDRDEFVKYGELLAMEFTNSNKKFHAFQFEIPDTKQKKYFDYEGKGVKKAFLKVPFKYDFRISSGFSYSRLHPVLGKRTPHYGVDYAAPQGTPVLASASGRVIFASRKGANGNLVKIKHPNGYVTYYLHLSKILVKSGQSVGQGDRIGLVGATGLATGPHLDYRIQDQRGKFINPKKYVALPSDKAVDDAHMKEFIAVRDDFLRQLESIPEAIPSRPQSITAE